MKRSLCVVHLTVVEFYFPFVFTYFCFLPYRWCIKRNKWLQWYFQSCSHCFTGVFNTCWKHVFFKKKETSLSSVLLIHNPLCPALKIALLIYADLIPGVCCVTAGSTQPEASSQVPANYFSRGCGLLVPCMQCLALPNIWHLLAVLIHSCFYILC